MSDETKPARIRGLKEREAAYKAGFADGCAHAHTEIAAQRRLEVERETAAEYGWKRVASEVAPTRRTRKRKEAPAITQSSASA